MFFQKNIFSLILVFGCAFSAGVKHSSFNTEGEGSGENQKSLSRKTNTSIICHGPPSADESDFCSKLRADNSTWRIIDRGSVDACIPIWELLEEEGFPNAANAIQSAYLNEVCQERITFEKVFNSDQAKPRYQKSFLDLIQKAMDSFLDQKPYKIVELVVNMVNYAIKMDGLNNDGLSYVEMLFENQSFLKKLKEVVMETNNRVYNSGKQFLRNVFYKETDQNYLATIIQPTDNGLSLAWSNLFSIQNQDPAFEEVDFNQKLSLTDLQNKLENVAYASDLEVGPNLTENIQNLLSCSLSDKDHRLTMEMLTILKEHYGFDMERYEFGLDLTQEQLKVIAELFKKAIDVNNFVVGDEVICHQNDGEVQVISLQLFG